MEKFPKLNNRGGRGWDNFLIIDTWAFPFIRQLRVQRTGSTVNIFFLAPRHASNSWSLSRISEQEDEDIISSI